MPTEVVRIPETTYTRGAWVDRYGHRHPAKRVEREGYTKKVRRKKKKRTPKGKRWYRPKVKMGWKKDMDQKKRRSLALKSHGGNVLSTARALRALANVTTDSETSRKAASDARYFFQLHEEEK